ncbi:MULTISPECIES: EVE domain-containing protein [Legionella]|uniref:EVE domain-containing protein n=2 Tax=Legionella TaxID=445 RepID=A0A364LIB7_9GAMM|nr:MULTISPECIES: EVE domain-containing protein [Legionella]MCE3044416.1 EVE domain-containing protein [Legionella sp. 16cNR16C]RAP35930.1 EVE domain-containing protein [Legionella quinlivanii]
MNYWLMKSEPSCFSIDDLQKAPNQTTHWDGVRNYQARNFIKEMSTGDQILFYHSNCTPPGIIGIAEITSKAYPDFTAFDPDSEHPDPKSTPENPRWFMVDVRFKEKFKRLISLEELKNYPELGSMPLLRKGNRLSVMPVSAGEWHFIQELK